MYMYMKVRQRHAVCRTATNSSSACKDAIGQLTILKQLRAPVNYLFKSTLKTQFPLTFSNCIQQQLQQTLHECATAASISVDVYAHRHRITPKLRRSSRLSQWLTHVGVSRNIDLPRMKHTQRSLHPRMSLQLRYP